jgi:pimeloyl-ACP methyl ester carboxylesterase
MISLTPYKTLLIVGFSLILNLGHAYDNAKETRWADQITDSIMVGDAEWLNTGKTKMFAIYTENTTENILGAAIVIHGIGVHPNWDQIIRPIRSQLPDHGWSTLSIQMPVLANDAKYSEYALLFGDIAPRINAAVKFLKKKGINNIVIIAHSMGANMAAYYMAKQPDKSIKALVAVGSAGLLFKDKSKNYLKSLETIKIPILDIFGAIDLPEVIETAKQKKQIADKAGNKAYSQLKIPGANHFFNNKDDVLIKHVRNWLAKNVPGKKTK